MSEYQKIVEKCIEENKDKSENEFKPQDVVDVLYYCPSESDLFQKAVQVLNAQTEEFKTKCIQINSTMIEYIDNPTENLQAYAVYLCPDVISCIKNPCVKAQVDAVTKQLASIINIDNPCMEAVNIVIQAKNMLVLPRLKNLSEFKQEMILNDKSASETLAMGISAIGSNPINEDLYNEYTRKEQIEMLKENPVTILGMSNASSAMREYALKEVPSLASWYYRNLSEKEIEQIQNDFDKEVEKYQDKNICDKVLDDDSVEIEKESNYKSSISLDEVLSL